MDIRIGSLLSGAREACGAVAVIDVFRAFTTAAVAFANGASQIVMVASVEEALSLRKSGVGRYCMGEVGGQAPPGFDFGNSPFEILDVDFDGAGLIQRTSAGTQGIVAAAGQSDVLYAAAFVTARATARALAAAGSPCISIAAMGNDALTRADEDELCALHLRNLIEGRPGNPDAVRGVILAGAEAQRFLNPVKSGLHREDLEIALDFDRFDFAIRVTVEDGRPIARRESAG